MSCGSAERASTHAAMVGQDWGSPTRRRLAPQPSSSRRMVRTKRVIWCCVMHRGLTCRSSSSLRSTVGHGGWRLYRPREWSDGTGGPHMLEDLMATWEELGHMLADVGENYGDMHPD